MNFTPAIHKRLKTLSRFGITVFSLVAVFATLVPQAGAQDDVPIITRIEPYYSLGFPAAATMTLINCNDTNYEYSVEASTNLINWQLWSNKYPAANSNETLQITRPFLPSTRTTFYRILKTPRIPIPLFPMALVASSTINLNGNNLRFDSFNSSDTNFSTGGLYDISKFSDHGDVGANSSLINAFDIGNARVYGKIHTSPGSVSAVVAIGPSGKVGDIAWHKSSESGIQPGFWLQDLYLTLPSATAPASGGFPPGPGLYGGTSYNYLLSASGGKYTSSTTLSGKMMVTGTNVVLWAKGGLNLSGSADGIFFAPGASLIVYVGHTIDASINCDLSGNGGFNANGVARNFQLYGLPSLTTIKMSGNTPFTGAIYAPNASLTVSGGGSNPKPISGALIVKSASITGHAEFHFDEDLKINGPFR